ncbi:hypothetical protein [Streptomyces sp. NPDC059455]|uniref:hypothetical protein n=1 Tax=Streptomyces sp. NPDC059455 TaxID=3346837 RepID=UPI00368D5B92
MASDDLLGMIRDLMVVERPAGTHLSQSSTPGGSSALVRNDDNALVTQAVLYPADDELGAVRAAGIRVGVAVGVTVGIAATVAVGAVAVKVVPHVKNKFNDLKSKLNRVPEDTVEAADQGARPKQCDGERTARRMLTEQSASSI